nr:hypothetical protein [uncultured Pseudomonas sp.]
MSTIVSSLEVLNQLDRSRHQELQKQRDNGPTYKITAFRDTETIDKDRFADQLLIKATGENGEPVDNELIVLSIEDPEKTDTRFIFRDGDKEYPVTETFGRTAVDGFWIPEDPLKAGNTTGLVKILGSAPYSEHDPRAYFYRTVSMQTPTKVEAVMGGDESFPAGSYVSVELSAKLLDELNAPISHGHIRFSVYDPNNTGTIDTNNGWEVLYRNATLDSTGTGSVGMNLVIGRENIGATFYVKVNRSGTEPSYLFSYTTLSP